MIYITGDTHGDIDIHKLTARKWTKQNELTRDDYLIICGDFGGVWYGNQKDNYILNWHENKSYTTLWIDGNHENFDALRQYPVEVWKGGKVQFIRPHIIHLMRGQIYQIDGSTFFTFGGGSSSDREYRKEGKSWWADEIPTVGEMTEAVTNLKQYRNQIDYVITHAAPQTVLWNDIPSHRAALRLQCPCEEFLETVMNQITYKAWFCGHYHQDIHIPHKRTRAMYDDIISLEQTGI